MTAHRFSGVVVLTTYNEADSIGPVLAEINEASIVLSRSDIHLSVLIVDDNSPDNTVDSARRVADSFDLDLSVIAGSGTGLGAAVLKGLQAARQQQPSFMIALDADGQHDARQIPDLVRAHLARHSDITIGSRWVRGGSSPGTSPVRTVISRTGNFLVRRVVGVRRVRDSTTSFRVFRPEVIDAIANYDIPTDGYAFFSALIAVAQSLGFSVDEVPITFRPRYSGVSKLTASEGVKFLHDLPRVRRLARRASATRQPDFGQGNGADRDYGAMNEMEQLAKAHRFNRWIVDALRIEEPKTVLEIGAGIGAITRTLAAQHPRAAITALEPSGTPFEQSVAVNGVRLLRETSAQHLAVHPSTYDCAIHVNVLEHIEDDTAELRNVLSLLRPGGTLHLFVPALPRLYGELDRRSGHYRRYRRRGLATVLRSAGFEIVRLSYFDLLGTVPYLFMSKRAKSSIRPNEVELFDRVWVPVSRTFDALLGGRPPVGKNLVAVARRPPA